MNPDTTVIPPSSDLKCMIHADLSLTGYSKDAE
jgi:hypothetical protein